MEHMYKTNLIAKANLSVLTETELNELGNSINPNFTKSSSSSNKDLMKIVSVLVSTGQNLNDDVFLRKELVPIRNSGKDKPLNMDHDENKIIGHMTKTFITDKNGTIISDKIVKSNKLPKHFDITNEAVVYKFLFPELAENIKQRAQEGRLFVSVEMWFSDYDYLVGSKLLKRNQATAFHLDKVLKINGGSGEFEGEKVGRVLRNMLIGGIGIVEVPANPESLIRSVSNIKETDINKFNSSISNSIIGDINNIDLQEDEGMNKAEVGELEVILDSAKAKLDADEKCRDEKLESLPKEVLVSINSIKDENQSLQNRVKELEFENIKISRVDTLVTELEVSKDFALEKVEANKHMNEEEFNLYKNELISFFKNSLDKAGHISSTASIETETETEVKTDTEVTVETETETETEVDTAVNTEDSKDSDSEVIDEDNVGETNTEEETSEVLDVEQIDPNINLETVETDETGEEDTTVKFAKTFKKHMVRYNDRWKNLKIEV